MTKLAAGQAVSINFTGEHAFTLVGVVIENIDHVCAPLVNMWRVCVTDGPEQGARFGISGAALRPL